jgi:putative ABC transport system permease protein
MVSAAIVLSVITGVYVLAGIGLVRLLARVRSDAGTPWRFGVAALARRPAQSVAQLVAFGLGMTILLLLGVVRGDLLEEWRRGVPADAPNHFLINIAPQERDSVEDFFKARQVVVEFAPWVRARLRAVNGTPMAQRMPKSDRGRAFAEREQNLSFRRTLPADNQIVEGHWWPVSGLGAAQVSVATEFRDELDLHLGDRLEFDVAGESVDATLASVRKVRWDGFRPNFFLLFSPGVLDGNVSSYLAAAHLEARVRPDLAEFNRRFPTVTVLDIDGLLTTVRGLVDRAADAVTYVFAFTLLAGLVVLAAAIRATADERRYEGALLRAFGASRRQVLLGAALEFATLGVLAGLVAATAAAAISAFVAAYWLGLPWHLQGLLWLFGPIAGLLGVGGAGLLGTWRMGLIPPFRVLQAS